MILPDSSAWIELLRKTGSATHIRLRSAVDLAEPLATTGMVMLEILAGARDERHANKLLELLATCHLIAPVEPADSEAAAALYRTCRRQGVTVRRLPDCLIAAVAIRAGAEVLHADANYDTLARHTALRIVEVGVGVG